MKNRETRQFLQFSAVVLSLLFVFFIILYANRNNTDTKIDDKNSQWIECEEVGQGFIYYNGEFYYKNKNFCLMSDEDVGEIIGVNEKHLKKSDIENNKFLYEEENICAYAVYIDTPVYNCKKRDDILLIKNEDYMWNGYYVYIKNVPYSESLKKASLKYYIDNQQYADSSSLVSYGRNEIPISIDLTDLKSNDNNTYTFSTTDIQQGYMAYYFFIENDGIYVWFKGSGNVLSDYIIIDSNEDDNTVQYIYKYDGLKDILLNMYSDFFGIKNSIENIESIDENILINQSNNNIDTTKELSEDLFNDVETYDKGKTQSDLSPLQ